jgi:hypothetical protein
VRKSGGTDGTPAQLVTVPLLDQRLQDLEQRLTIKMGWRALAIIGALSTVSTLLHIWK